MKLLTRELGSRGKDKEEKKESDARTEVKPQMFIGICRISWKLVPQGDNQNPRGLVMKFGRG